jgi:autotransporter-associated beta strand protein
MKVHHSKACGAVRAGLASMVIVTGGQAADMVQNVTLAVPAIIDPIDSNAAIARDVTRTATNATDKTELEALQGFKVIQNFSAAGNLSLDNDYILNATDAPSTPDFRLKYGATVANKSFQISGNSGFSTSPGSSLRIESADGNASAELRIEAGSWDEELFIFTPGEVAALGFTLSGPFERLIEDSATVRYFDAADQVLSEQVITSGTAVAAYTGHHASSGPLIRYAVISFTGDNATPVAILALDDIGFAPDASLVPTALKWRVGNGAWTAGGALNWQPLGGGAPTAYSEGTAVTFDDSASGVSPIAIELTGTLSPSAVTVDSTKDYIFLGGEIGGGGALSKLGTGTLTIRNENALAGPTLLTDGTLQLENSLGLKGSTVTLGGGPLVFDSSVSGGAFALGGLAGPTGFDLVLATNAATPAPVTLTVGANNANTVFSGALGGGGLLIKDGSGSLTLSGFNSHSGGTTLTGNGFLRITNPDAVGTGPLLLQSSQTSFPVTFELNGGFNFAHPITIDSNSGREFISATGGAGILSGPITVTGESSNMIVFSGDGGAGNPLTISGGIDAPNYFGTFSFRGGGGGLLSSELKAPQAAMELTQNANNIVWTISSTGNDWTVTRFISGAGASVGGVNQGFSGGRIVLGTENALPTAVRVLWASNNGNITGFDQTVAGLDKPGVYPNEETVPHSIPVITNTSATEDATLTLAELATDYIFTGRLEDGPTNRLSLVLDSAGRIQSLTRASTYTGDTTIRNGTLSVASPNFADTSTLTINGDGVLDLPNSGSPDVVATLIIDGITMPAGTVYHSGNSNGAITGEGSISVGGGTGDYENWVALYQPGFVLTQPGDDPDGDGLTNSVEHAFGLNPTSAASASPIVSGLTSGGQFSYTRRATTGLTYKIFTSPTLAGWTQDTGATQAPGVPNSNGVQTVLVTLTSPAVDGKLFARVVAE